MSRESTQAVNRKSGCLTANVQPQTGVDKTWTPSFGYPSGRSPQFFSFEKKINNKFKLYTIRLLDTTASFAV